MTCPTCLGTGAIVRQGRRRYAFCRDCAGDGCIECRDTGHALEVGPVVDGCPACAAEAEAEWQALTLPPIQRRYVAE